MMLCPFLQDDKFDHFIACIDQGDGLTISEKDLAQFVSLLPSSLEVTKFKNRLAEFNLDSFAELQSIKKPLTLKKLGKPEAFVIKVLENEGVIMKAQTLEQLINSENDFNCL